MGNGRGWDLLPPGRQEQESSKLTEWKELDRGHGQWREMPQRNLVIKGLTLDLLT